MPRPSSSARGYDRAHQRKRKHWQRVIAGGGVRCARGAGCRFAEAGLGGIIHPDEAWDLGHDDHDRSIYTGPEHAACNRATKAHQPPRQRPAEDHPGILKTPKSAG